METNEEKLYFEVLHQIIDNISKCDYVYVSTKGDEVDQLAMLSYIQEVFNVSDDRHAELLIRAKAKKFPELLLSVEVMEGRDLVDESGSPCDTFVTLYLMSDNSRRYSTSVQPSTAPTWDEHFSMCTVEGNAVMSYKLVEEAMKNLSIFATDVTKIESKERQNRLIGKANMPLKSILEGDIIHSLNVNCENGRSRGTLEVRSDFSLDNDLRIAVKEYRRLFRKLMLHELEKQEIRNWCGDFSPPAEAILAEYVAQTGISQIENLLTHWVIYCSLISEHPISFSLFETLTEKNSHALQSGLINEEGATFFWKAAKSLLLTCFDYIKVLRNANVDEEMTSKTLTEILTILSKLSLIDSPNSVDLFPATTYGLLTHREDGMRLIINEILHDVVTKSVCDWFVDTLSHESEDKTGETRLKHLISVIQSVRSDLQRAILYFDSVFAEVLSFPYSKVLRDALENKITILMEPEVMLLCKSLRCLRSYEGSPLDEQSVTDSSYNVKLNLNPGEFDSNSNSLAMGSTLFELYLALKRLKQDIGEMGWTKDTELKMHSWFFGGVTLWLDMAAFKAVTGIDKAVELDSLVPEAPNVNYSSSSVDSVANLYQIYDTFWHQLAWPVDEDSFAFVVKIIDDVCRCCMFFSDKMSSRLEMVDQTTEELYRVTPQHCVIINNIGFVLKNLAPLIAKLGIDDIIQKLCQTRMPSQSEICRYRETVHNLIENAKDAVSNKIEDLLDAQIKNIIPCFITLLINNAELLESDCSSVDRIMRYLEANFNTLHQNLNIENFSRTLELFWEQLGEALYELIQVSLEKQRPPSFFRNVLYKCLPVMEHSLRQDGKELQKTETLKCVEYMLKSHGTETKDLIHQYHLQRWQEQQAISDRKSLLTVRTQFNEEHFRIKIMNARQLALLTSNGLCSSYVKITFLPRHLFSNIKSVKTQIHSKNSFPLYDEAFLVPLDPELRGIEDALVHFVIKDKDKFSVRSTFLGEAYLHFKEVKHTSEHPSNLPQQHLPLSQPKSSDNEIIEMLEFRKTDKEAREFLTKQKQKMPHKKLSIAMPTPRIPDTLVKLIPSRMIGSIVSHSLQHIRKVSKDKKGTS